MGTYPLGVALPLLALTLALSPPVLPAARGQEPTGDLARLQGQWSANIQLGARKTTVVIEFKGNDVFTTMGNSPSATPATRQEVRIDERANPKTLDFVNGKNLEAKPGSAAEKVGVPNTTGIYELDGDTLRVASIPFSDKRPTSLKPAKGIVVLAYTRGMTPATGTEAAKASPPATRPVLGGDLALLQGTWKVKSGQLNAEHETLTIQGDTLIATAKVARGEVRYSSQIRLYETSSPKAIDFLNPAVGTKSHPAEYGIYQLDGDTLTIHKSGMGKGRASVFKTGAEQGMVSVWTRVASRRGTSNSDPAPAASAPPTKGARPSRRP